MNRGPIELSPAEVTDYDSRRREVLAAMKSLPRGASTECAFDLRVAPTIVSRVLNGKETRPDILTRIADWIMERRA